MPCSDCIWVSSGFNDGQAAGYCYLENDYVDPDGNCSFWQASLRDEPFKAPPALEVDGE